MDVLSVVRKNQAEFKRMSRELQSLCVGGVFTMKSRYIADIVTAAGGVGSFADRVVLEVGCAVGNICHHLLEFGARQVIGMDFPEVLRYVPPELKDREGATFVGEDFLNVREIPSDISVITMFIGLPPLVQHLFKLFVASKHVQVIIFMIPVYSDDRASMHCDIDRLFPEDEFVVSEKVKVELEGMGTVRHCLVIHRINF
jgi:hypothetical protein